MRGRFEETPLEQVGNCWTRLDPVSISVEQAVDDPATDERESGTIVWGLARNDVRRVTVSNGRGSQTLAPEAEGAFVRSFERGFAGDTAIEVEFKDGQTRELPSMKLPDFDALSAELREDARKPGFGPDEHGHADSP